MLARRSYSRPVLAIVLGLGTSVAYGTSNFLGPRLARVHPLGAVLLTSQVAALVACAVLLAVSGEALPALGPIAVGLLAGAGNILGVAAFYRAAQEMSVSVVSAVAGALGTSLPVVFGLTTGDTLSTLQVCGILVAIAGAVLASQGSEHAVVTTGGVVWSLLAAVGFATLLIALPEAADDGTWWALFDARVAVVALLAGGLVVLGADARVPVRAWPALSVPGLLLLVGTIAYAEAAARGQLSIVAVLASLATVVTAALSAVAGERLSRVQLAGIAAATAGVALLAL